MQRRFFEFIVGLFVLAALGALFFLAFQVSGLTFVGKSGVYQVTADFDNIGGLKVRAPIKISGVTIGSVSSIGLDPKNFMARVTLSINDNFNNLPQDSALSILTEGILGANYISLTPGYSDKNLKAGSEIQTTHSALILENLIGQLVYTLKSGDKDKTTSSSSPPPSTSAQSSKQLPEQPAAVVE